MMQILQDFQITCTLPISILCDNTSAISISKNPVMHSKTKHIPIKYHFLLEQVLQQKVKLEYVPSKEQVADILTKPLPRETFEYRRQKLGVVDASSCCSNLLFQRKVVVHEFNEDNPCTYTGLCGYSHVYVGFKTNSGPSSG